MQPVECAGHLNVTLQKKEEKKEGMKLISSESVSYTHLDVYKRQECSRTLRRRSRMSVPGEPGVTNEGDGTAYAEG